MFCFHWEILQDKAGPAELENLRALLEWHNFPTDGFNLG